jgi:carboxypeptidase C (cathepsin A)
VIRILAAASLLSLAFLAATAASAAPPAPAAAAPAGFAPREFVSHHEGVFGGQRVRFTATAGDTVLSNDAGAPAATIFSFSYVRDDVKDKTTRPVLFVWNGGPGSSSVWEHLGLFGPKRVALRDEVHPPTTVPFALEDNPNSPLDVADIVLIDPPGTGFSRVLPGGDPKAFYGVEQDGAAMVQFIETWLRSHDRMNSPRLIVGESYGVPRAIVVSRMMMGGPFAPVGRLVALPLNGVVVMGGSIGDSVTGESGDMTYVNTLPTMAMTAWYHDKSPRAGRTLEAVLAEAQAMQHEYLDALYVGDRMPAQARDAFVAKLAAITGLSPDFIRSKNLRVGMDDFRSELLRDKGLELGAYDSRYTLPTTARLGRADPVADDPAMGQYTPSFVGAFDTYLRNDLGVKVDETYDAIDFKVNGRWDYSSPTTRSQDLQAAMRANPRLKLMVIGGDFDAVANWGAIDNSVAHSGLPAERVTLKNYASGHMAYLGDAPSAALARDLRAFILAASAPGQP